MYGDLVPHEDDFNAWVSSYGRHVMGIKAVHPKDEECWMIVIDHKDFLVPTSTISEVELFLAKAKSEGFTFRSWRKNLKDEKGHIIGEAIMFAYDF